MKKLIMMKGLPASGKTTFAKDLVVNGGYKRINKDDLRAMIDNSIWTKGNEKSIVELRDIMISHFLEKNQSVIIDDTNFAEHHEVRLRELAKENNASFSVHFIDTPLEECIARDMKRENSVGKRVITQMYYQYFDRENVLGNTDGQVVICDIDGTLAYMKDRGPYDYEDVSSDGVHEQVKILLDMFRDDYKKIVLCTGRDGSCKEATIKRLTDNQIFYDELYIREEGDTRKDFVVKKEMLDKIGKGNVFCAIDDRPQVLRMWRKEGIFTFNVGSGRDF